MPIPALAEFQHPQPLSPLNWRLRFPLLPAMKALPVLISVVTSLDLVINPTLIGAPVRECSSASAVWGRAKLSCIFNPHKTSCNCINEMTHKRTKRKDQLKQEKKVANSYCLNRAKSLNILRALTCVISWVEMHRWTAQFSLWSPRSSDGPLAFWWTKSCNFCFCPQPAERLKQLYISCCMHCSGKTMKSSGVNIYGTITKRQNSILEKQLQSWWRKHKKQYIT